MYKSVFFTASGSIKARLASQNAVKACPEILTFMQDEAERLKMIENRLAALNVLKSTAAVLQIAQNIIDRYDTYKEIYATLDYEDLIVITRRLLEDKSVADWVYLSLTAVLTIFN